MLNFRHSCLILLLVVLLQAGSVSRATAEDSVPLLPLPEGSNATPDSPTAHLLLRELSTRQQDWHNAHGSFAMLATLFPSVLEQEGVVYNVEANGEWLLQGSMLVFQVLDDMRQDYDALAWEQELTWSVNASGEINSRSRVEQDRMARELLDMVNAGQNLVYDQTHTYLSLADLTRNNILPADSFRPLYTSLGYQVARPAQGLLLIQRAGKESTAQRNLWYGAVAFGGNCAWLQESGKRMRILPYMTAGTDGLERILRSALRSLVAAQNRYKGAYQHYGSLQDLSGLYYERLDFSADLPQNSAGVSFSFEMSEDSLGYTVIVELSGRRLYTDQDGEINAPMQNIDGGAMYLPLPGTAAETGFVPDDGALSQPAEGLETALRKARIELVSTVLNQVHNAQEAHLIRHGGYASLVQLQEDGLLELDEGSADAEAAMDGVVLQLELSEDAETYVLEGQAGDVVRFIDETGNLSERAT